MPQYSLYSFQWFHFNNRALLLLQSEFQSLADLIFCHSYPETHCMHSAFAAHLSSDQRQKTKPQQQQQNPSWFPYCNYGWSLWGWKKKSAGYLIFYGNGLTWLLSKQVQDLKWEEMHITVVCLIPVRPSRMEMHWSAAEPSSKMEEDRLHSMGSAGLLYNTRWKPNEQLMTTQHFEGVECNLLLKVALWSGKWS